MEEFISLGDDPTQDPTASEPQPQHHGPTDGVTKDIIDLEQGQVDAAVNLNAPPETETLPSQQQPQYSVSTTGKASSSSVVEIIDLEEGQVACQESGAQDAQGAAAAADNLQAKAEEALGANGVEPPLPSQQQPQDGATKAASDEIIDLEEGQVEDMDLSDDNAVLVTKHGVSVETAKGSDGPEAAPLPRPSSAFIDQSRIL